jgi:hypothetical protein
MSCLSSTVSTWSSFFAHSSVAAILVGFRYLARLHRERRRRIVCPLLTTDGQRAIAKAVTSRRCRFLKSAERLV